MLNNTFTKNIGVVLKFALVDPLWFCINCFLNAEHPFKLLLSPPHPPHPALHYIRGDNNEPFILPLQWVN